MYAYGIILAAGKGKRMNSHTVNKVSLEFAGKPIITFAVELLQDICLPIVVVVGAFSKSVQDCLKNYNVVYAQQKKRLGTAHATKVGFEKLRSLPKGPVIVGYGDHMMFYKKAAVRKLIKLQSDKKAAVALITTLYPKPDQLSWGRIIRDKDANIIDSVEQKDATYLERKIREFNAGLYCFDFDFLKKNIGRVKKSGVSGEYYINALVKTAARRGEKVVGLEIPFSQVGIGINRIEELKNSEHMYIHRKKSHDR